MSHINRRTVVTGIASAVPVAAVGAAPTLAASSGELSFPDLAARFDALYARWRDWNNASHARSELFDARLQAVTGLSRDEQARVLAYRFAHCWTDDLDQDPEGWGVRMFVDSVCAVAGIEALPGLAAARPLMLTEA